MYIKTFEFNKNTKIVHYCRLLQSMTELFYNNNSDITAPDDHLAIFD